MVLHRNRDRARGRDVFVMDEAGSAMLRLTGEDDFAWVTGTVNRVLAGVTVRKAWHFEETGEVAR